MEYNRPMEYIRPINGVVQPPVKPPSGTRVRRTNVLESLRSLLEKIFFQSFSYHFRYPVDSIALRIPDYHQIIKHPMDLNTIRQRFRYNYYRNGNEALRDFELVINNCMIYNPQGTEVYIAGKKLQSEFYTLLSGIDLCHEREVKKRKKKSRKHSRKRRKAVEQNEAEGPAAMSIYNESNVNYQTENQSQKDIEQETESDAETEVVNDPDILQSHLQLVYDWQNFLIEKHHCEHLLETLAKKKRFSLNWPFINVEHWRCFGRNPRYDHDKVEKLDWGILKSRLEHNKFNSFNEFVEKIREMFQNALTCFATDTNVVDTVFKLNEFLESRLGEYKRSIDVIKVRIRRMGAEKIKDFEYAIAQETQNME